MRSLSWFIIPLLFGAATVHASNRGIPITPDEAGQFEYADDFTTPRLFRDAFLSNFSTDCWQALLYVWLAQGFGKPQTEARSQPSRLLGSNAVEVPKPRRNHQAPEGILNAHLAV